jgi:hypothetical protein
MLSSDKMDKKVHAKKNILIVVVLVALILWILYTGLQQVKTFEMTQDPIANPLMGWAPWATIQESEQPYTLVYADLTWREFEPQEGIFDFKSFELKNQFERWRAEGKRVVFRFVLDVPGSEPHMDIPDWLYAKINGDGDFYDSDYGKGFAPNYANPILIEYHQKTIAALGERYAQDDFIAYIELGSIGHWGEWHVKSDSGIRSLPETEIRDIYVNHYLAAFPNTFLLMRRPFSISENNKIGFYNDMTADYSSTITWLGWIADGGSFDQTGESNALVALPDQWKIAPIGGEQTPSLKNTEVYFTSLSQTIELLRQSHTTFIGPNGVYEGEEDGSLQEGVDQVLSNIGYRLYIEKIKLPLKIHAKGPATIVITFSNGGVAPMYYQWPVFLYLFDDQNNLVNFFSIEMDVRSILPGDSSVVKYDLSVEGLKNGRYSLGIAIHDPKTNLPAVQFAMANSRDDSIQILASFEIDR